LALAAALGVATTGCGGDEHVEVDRGPLDDTIDDAARRVWPGRDVPGQGRVVSLNNGFVDGRQVSYWFAGLASPVSADVFWFCREGDDGCPLDERGAIDFSRTVGRPVFARMPGEQSYSPYWWIRVVRVPDDYEPDAIKSVLGINEAIQAGRVRFEWYHFNHGGSLGPDKAIQNTVLVLDGTSLEGNGADLPGQLGVASEPVPIREGWHQQYRVWYYDFTHTEGVFPPESSKEEEWTSPSMAAMETFLLFRDCSAGAESSVCAGAGSMRGAVSERALQQDLTADGDLSDTNDVLAAVPGQPSADGPRYSPAWAAMEVVVGAEANIELIDSSRDDGVSDIRDIATLRGLVTGGLLSPPAAMAPARFDERAVGEVAYVNCPAQVPAQ